MPAARIRISGRLTAQNGRTGNLGDRKIRPFNLPASAPWVVISDEAFERTFNQANEDRPEWALEDDSSLDYKFLPVRIEDLEVGDHTTIGEVTAIRPSFFPDMMEVEFDGGPPDDFESRYVLGDD
jgi:hypothetical protein